MIKRTFETLMGWCLKEEIRLAKLFINHTTVDPSNHEGLEACFRDLDQAKRQLLELKTKGEITWMH